MFYNPTTEEYGLFIPVNATGWEPIPNGWVKPIPEPVVLESGSDAPKILRKDDAWRMGWFNNVDALYRWTSAFNELGQVVETQTGSLDYGYFTCGKKIHLAVCGGGASRGNLKTISILDKDENVLLTKTLGEVSNRDIGEPFPSVIDTTGFEGLKIFIRFNDQDNINAAFAWIGVNLSSIVIED